MRRTRRAPLRTPARVVRGAFPRVDDAAGVKDPKADGSRSCRCSTARRGPRLTGRSGRATLDGWQEVVGRLNARALLISTERRSFAPDRPSLVALA